MYLTDRLAQQLAVMIRESRYDNGTNSLVNFATDYYDCIGIMDKRSLYVAYYWYFFRCLAVYWRQHSGVNTNDVCSNVR